MATASRRFTRCERGPVVHLLADADQLVGGTVEQVFAGEDGAGTAARGQAVATDRAGGARRFESSFPLGIEGEQFAVAGGDKQGVVMQERRRNRQRLYRQFYHR